MPLEFLFSRLYISPPSDQEVLMWKWMTALCLAGSIVFAADSGVSTFEFEEGSVTAIQDAPGGMALSIFSGGDAAAMKRRASKGRIPSSFNVFLIQKNGKRILVDAGNGGRKGTLMKKLQNLGIAPDQIDAVLLTHMHGDHIGGLLTADNKAAFPKAAVYIAEKEHGYWARQKNSAIAQQVLRVYRKRLHVFPFNSSVSEGISARDAVGHTPGHTIFEFGKIRFIGDLIHGAALQFADPAVCAVYDMNRNQAVAVRRRVLENAAENKELLAGGHLPYPGIGTVRKNADGTMTFVPLRTDSGTKRQR